MDGKIMIMYPKLIIYALIICGIILFAWSKKEEIKKGIVVANTKYVKKLKYFKNLNTKYRVFSTLIKVVCIILVLFSAILTARIYEIKRYQSEYNNRDIMLCMDFSPSMALLNYDLLETMDKTVDSLKTERFGITIFDSNANMVSPLTTDYHYIKYALNDLKESFYFNRSKNKVEKPSVDGNGNSVIDMSQYLNAETNKGILMFDGASRVSDALAVCASNFNDNDRTKIIIFSTDNLGSGMIVTLKEASKVCQERNIKVYPIGARTIEDNQSVGGFINPRGQLIDVAKDTGGKYFDYAKYSINEINNEIENLNTSAIVNTVFTSRNDLPEKIFPYVLYTLVVLLFLDWRIRV